VVLLGLTVGLLACGSDPSTDGATRAGSPVAGADTMTIDDVLRTDGRFSTLVGVLDSTGLDSTLRGDGPYTLFAPPNSAFEALPAGTMPVLINERRDRLRAILSLHVVPDGVPLPKADARWSGRSLSGDSLQVTVTDTSARIRNAHVVDADIKTANGRIHVIDRVLQPATEDAGSNGR